MQPYVVLTSIPTINRATSKGRVNLRRRKRTDMICYRHEEWHLIGSIIIVNISEGEEIRTVPPLVLMLALPMIQIWDFAAFIFARLARIKWVTEHIQKGTIFTRARNKAAPDIPNFYLVAEIKLTSFPGSNLYEDICNFNDCLFFSTRIIPLWYLY